MRRIRCWFRGYHVYGMGRFRYDVAGICDHCGVVGKPKADWDDWANN